MEEILESIMNGQRKQALSQLRESSFNLEDLLEELRNSEDINEMVTIVKVAFSTGYITSDFE